MAVSKVNVRTPGSALGPDLKLKLASKSGLTLRFAAAAALLLLLGACAPQSQLTAPGANQAAAAPAAAPSAEQTALRNMIAMQDRLFKIASPLLTANAPLCKGNARYLLGFTAKNKYSYSKAMASAAQSLGYDDRLQVTDVLPGSGAANNGVQRGDYLVSAGDRPIPQGENAERLTATVLAPLMAGKMPVKLVLQRGGAPMNVTVPLTLACSFSVELGNVDTVNAYSDGSRVLVTRGMMNFARSDEELAYLIAREIAHDALAHPGRQKMVKTIGDIITNLMRTNPDATTLAGTGGILPYGQDMDAAADTLSLYMLVRAGYSIDNAPAFWKRLAAAYPASVPNGYTAIHPSTAYRLAMIGKVTQIINAKKAAGKPLLP
ncbi:peptidase M48 [Oxalobacteraceae bacterium CAVE-383]|nr:peptidase M48 [Oxalobacteraceae bacterium CAVE-383]